MEDPIKMDDLGIPLFLETPIQDRIPICTVRIIIAYAYWYICKFTYIYRYLVRIYSKKHHKPVQ